MRAIFIMIGILLCINGLVGIFMGRLWLPRIGMTHGGQAKFVGWFLLIIGLVVTVFSFIL